MWPKLKRNEQHAHPVKRRKTQCKCLKKKTLWYSWHKYNYIDIAQHALSWNSKPVGKFQMKFPAQNRCQGRESIKPNLTRRK